MTASGPPTTGVQGTESSTLCFKNPSPACPTISRRSTNLKAPANTAAPSPTRIACAMVREWYVGADTVLAATLNLGARVRMDMLRLGERGGRCRPNGRLLRRLGVACPVSICLELPGDFCFCIWGTACVLIVLCFLVFDLGSKEKFEFAIAGFDVNWDHESGTCSYSKIDGHSHARVKGSKVCNGHRPAFTMFSVLRAITLTCT